MTLSDSELYNVCNYLLHARKDRGHYPLDVHRPRPGDDDAPSLNPFDYLGAGRDREAWAYKGFAFKLQHPSPTSGGNPNIKEFENYQKIMEKSMPANMRVPETRLIEVDQEPVIVMQHIPGPTLDDMGDWESAIGIPWKDVYDGMTTLGLNDNSDCNFIYDKDTQVIYVLDLTT